MHPCFTCVTKSLVRWIYSAVHPRHISHSSMPNTLIIDIFRHVDVPFPRMRIYMCSVCCNAACFEECDICCGVACSAKRKIRKMCRGRGEQTFFSKGCVKIQTHSNHESNRRLWLIFHNSEGENACIYILMHYIHASSISIFGRWTERNRAEQFDLHHFSSGHLLSQTMFVSVWTLVLWCFVLHEMFDLNRARLTYLTFKTRIIYWGKKFTCQKVYLVTLVE